MKTNTSLVIAIIAFSMFASNAFALFKSPYPRRALPPDDNIVIADNNRIEEVTSVYARMMLLLGSDTRAL